MTGYKTIVTMLLGLAFSVMQSHGWIVVEDDQAAIQTAVMSLAAIGLRLITKTPAFKAKASAPVEGDSK